MVKIPVELQTGEEAWLPPFDVTWSAPEKKLGVLPVSSERSLLTLDEGVAMKGKEGSESDESSVLDLNVLRNYLLAPSAVSKPLDASNDLFKMEGPDCGMSKLVLGTEKSQLEAQLLPVNTVISLLRVILVLSPLKLERDGKLKPSPCMG